MYKKMLVAFDGSDAAKTALKNALELATLTKAELKVIHVPHIMGDAVMAGTMPVQFPASPEMVERAIWEIKDSVEETAEAMGTTPPEVLVRSGEPAHEILGVIKEYDIDLVIMGRRGLGDVTGLLLGSVTHKVQARSQCAVLTLS